MHAWQAEPQEHMHDARLGLKIKNKALEEGRALNGAPEKIHGARDGNLSTNE